MAYLLADLALCFGGSFASGVKAINLPYPSVRGACSIAYSSDPDVRHTERNR
jgi:hypothetical protein